jgi:hypothetical protein
MHSGTRALILLAIVGLPIAGLPIALRAQTFTGGTKPYVLQGKLAKDQSAAQQSGWFPVSIGVVGHPDTPVRWIGLASFMPWDDDPFEGREVMRRLLPDQPTLLVDGPPALLSQLKNAPVGNKVVLRGMLVPESRNFMLSGVQVMSASTKTPK